MGADTGERISSASLLIDQIKPISGAGNVLVSINSSENLLVL